VLVLNVTHKKKYTQYTISHSYKMSKRKWFYRNCHAGLFANMKRGLLHMHVVKQTLSATSTLFPCTNLGKVWPIIHHWSGIGGCCRMIAPQLMQEAVFHDGSSPSHFEDNKHLLESMLLIEANKRNGDESFPTWISTWIPAPPLLADGCSSMS
jgi:hypothetical protein